MTVLMAFTLEHASRVTGVSERRIRYWDETGVLSPSVATGSRRVPYGRIYSFRDLVGLRTLGQLRDTFGLPLQTLRAIGRRLRCHSDAPWSSLRFFVEGEHLFFRDPDSQTVVSAIRPGQIAMPFVLALSDVVLHLEAEASKLTVRDPAQIGEVEQNRYVLSNRPVLAGTRIPTAAVWDFHEAGYGTEAIIDLYPPLTRRDVERALDFERGRRAKRAS